MRNTLILNSSILFVLLASQCIGQSKTIHVYVALCDNVHQGIVPVSKKLGNGQDPSNNLYWGAMYGLKSYFKNIAIDWELVSSYEDDRSYILDAVLFKRKTSDSFLYSEAYDGKEIKTCVKDFLKASNHQGSKNIEFEGRELKFAGASDLVSYVGHNGLMDFNVNVNYNPVIKPKECIMLCCFAKDYFSTEMKSSNANPILWTTHLMAPEAYTLEASISAWLTDKTNIRESAAQAYNKYQKCGINAARGLFRSGFN